MEQNIKNKILRAIKISFLFSFLFVEFFGFGFIHSALAGYCKTTIAFDANPKTSPVNQPIIYSGYVTFSGSSFNTPGSANAGYCNDNGGNPVNSIVISFNNNLVAGSNKTVTINVPQNVNAQQLPFSLSYLPSSDNLPANQTYNVYASVYSAGHFDVNMAQSSAINISLTNAISATYGCKASDGIYACGNGASDCSDITACKGLPCTLLPDSRICGTAGAIGGQCSYDSDCNTGQVCDQTPSSSTYEHCIAQSANGNSSSNQTSNGSNVTAPLNTVSGSSASGASGGTSQTTTSGNNSSVTLYNPLPENDLTHVFLLITKSFLDIMGIFAVIFIIVGGFQMVISSGDEEAYTKAKKTITWAVLGLAVALLSFSIVAIVEDLLQVNIPPPTTSSSSSSAPSQTSNPTTLPSNPTTLPSNPTTP